MIGGLRAIWLSLAAGAFLLSACGGGGREAPPEPSGFDAQLTSGRKLARFAFERGQYDQAAILYGRALSLAYARDEAEAIGDIGYELAVTELRRGNAEEAASQANSARQELSRRGVVPFPDLLLVEAVARYAAGQPQEAEQLADGVLEQVSGSSLLAARAHFVKGQVAADDGDVEGLNDVLRRLGSPQEPALRADRQELAGRAALLSVDPDRALSLFEQTVELRRGTDDFTGMARALSLAAEAAERSGRISEAADLYFRAGRSADARHAPEDAKRWLTAAARLAESSGELAILEEAQRHLSQFD
jgi:tetratricopeptide (TPR) repeat protein